MRTLASFPDVGALGADNFREVSTIHLWDGACLRHQLVGVAFQRRHHAAHHAVVAQVPYQCPRINLRQHGNLELFEILFRDLLRAPVGTGPRKLADDQALDIRTRGFIVFGVGAVVADFGIGENYNLAAVGRVGENFLIASDGSIKNDFAVAFAFGAVTFASEDSAVFERKRSLHSCSREWILEILSGMSKSRNK